LGKKAKVKPVPEESLRRKRKFPRGDTVFTRPAAAEKWEWSVHIGVRESLPEDRFYIGRVVRKGKIYVAYSRFFKYPMDCYTSCEDAVAFLKERYDEEKMLESGKWAPGGPIKDVRFGRAWNNRGVKGWNGS